MQNHVFLTIKFEIMDGSWHSRCLNNPINFSQIRGSFASGATASLVAKNMTKKNFSNIFIFYRNFVLSRGRHLTKGLFCFFIELCLMILHKKFQVNSTNICCEKWDAFRGHVSHWWAHVHVASHVHGRSMFLDAHLQLKTQALKPRGARHLWLSSP